MYVCHCLSLSPLSRLCDLSLCALFRFVSPSRSHVSSFVLSFSRLAHLHLLGYRYKTHFHGIASRTTDLIDEKVLNLDAAKVKLSETIERQDTRVSLTIRIVPLVLREKQK